MMPAVKLGEQNGRIQFIQKKVILLGETSTRTVAHTLKVIHSHTFDYPPKAVSVSAEDQGMEYQ
jgi:hypothetical protein